MRIEGSVRSNLLAAIASAKRWRGKHVHSDTIKHWHLLAEYAGRVDAQPSGERVGDLIQELEVELSRARVRQTR